MVVCLFIERLDCLLFFLVKEHMARGAPRLRLPLLTIKEKRNTGGTPSLRSVWAVHEPSAESVRLVKSISLHLPINKKAAFQFRSAAAEARPPPVYLCFRSKARKQECSFRRRRVPLVPRSVRRGQVFL